MSRPVLIDLFAGSGGCSWGYYLAGFDVVAVDIKMHKRHPAFHGKPYSKHFKFIQADAMTYPLDGASFIHASPPCQKFCALRHMPTARKDHPDLIEATRARLVASGIPYCIENVDGAPLGASGYLIMLCGSMFGLETADGRAELRRHRLFETSFSIPLRPACQHGHVSLGVYGGHVRDRCRKEGVLSVAGHAYEVSQKADRNNRKVLTVTEHTPVDNAGRGKDSITVAGNRAMGGQLGQRPAICVNGTGNPLAGPMKGRTSERGQSNVDRTRQVFTIEQAREAMQCGWMTMAGLSQAIPPPYCRWIGEQFLAYARSKEML